MDIHGNDYLLETSKQFNYQYQSDLSVPFRLESEHQAIQILFVILLYLAPHPETKKWNMFIVKVSLK